MDHYEELGLPRSASPEQIRQAYRRLARLLHPDHCVDEEGRRLADLQMKRLNGILKELTDPASRSSYDRRLLAAPAGVLPVVSPARLRLVLWTATAIASLLTLAWIMPRPRVTTPAALTASPSPIVSTFKPNAATPRRRRRTTKRQAEAAPSGPLVNSPIVPVPSEPLVPSARDIPPIPLPFTPSPKPPTMLPSDTGFAGEWLYVPSIQAKENGLYPPEFIELHVTENAGELTGHYRARYRVLDRAISPEVDFRFRGYPTPNGILRWKGVGGASGNVALHRMANGTLEVSWIAEELGEELGLVSGKATLVRKRE